MGARVCASTLPIAAVDTERIARSLKATHDMQSVPVLPMSAARREREIHVTVAGDFGRSLCSLETRGRAAVRREARAG